MTEKVEKAQYLHGEFAEQDIITGRRSKSGVVLRPQPTNDPNEPLVKGSCRETTSCANGDRIGRNGRSIPRILSSAGSPS